MKDDELQRIIQFNSFISEYPAEIKMHVSLPYAMK
jgi:hypothetical protein